MHTTSRILQGLLAGGALAALLLSGCASVPNVGVSQRGHVLTLGTPSDAPPLKIFVKNQDMTPSTESNVMSAADIFIAAPIVATSVVGISPAGYHSRHDTERPALRVDLLAAEGAAGVRGARGRHPIPRRREAARAGERQEGSARAGSGFIPSHGAGVPPARRRFPPLVADFKWSEETKYFVRGGN